MVEQQDAAARWVGQQRDKHEGAGRVSGSMNEDHVLLRSGIVQARRTRTPAQHGQWDMRGTKSGRDENDERLAGLLTDSQA